MDSAALGSPGMAPPDSALTVAVTGASGFIGGALVARLWAQGADGRPARVRPMASSPESVARVQSRFAGLPVTMLQGLDAEGLRSLFEGVHVFVHAGWSSVPSTAERDPLGDLRTNVEGSLRLFQAALLAGVRRIVFLSSGGTVYGEPRWSPITEDHPTEPVGVYGASKLCAERYLVALARTHGAESVVLRPANVYGRSMAHDKPQGVVENWMARLRQGADLECWNDPRMVRDYIHVDDLVDALVAALHRPVKETVLNVGTGHGTDLRQLAGLLERITGHTARLRTMDTVYPALSINVLDNAKLRQVLGTAPQIALEEGLARTWATLGA